jgi:hypothetical protein
MNMDRRDVCKVRTSSLLQKKERKKKDYLTFVHRGSFCARIWMQNIGTRRRSLLILQVGKTTLSLYGFCQLLCENLFVHVHPQDTPQQENGYDCGVFTCQFLASLARGEETFNFCQANMGYIRRRMIWEICHATLRDET